MEPITEVFDKFGNIDADKLECWLINHQIDPNDPRFVNLFLFLINRNFIFIMYVLCNHP